MFVRRTLREPTGCKTTVAARRCGNKRDIVALQRAHGEAASFARGSADIAGAKYLAEALRVVRSERNAILPLHVSPPGSSGSAWNRRSARRGGRRRQRAWCASIRCSPGQWGSKASEAAAEAHAARQAAREDFATRRARVLAQGCAVVGGVSHRRRARNYLCIFGRNAWAPAIACPPRPGRAVGAALGLPCASVVSVPVGRPISCPAKPVAGEATRRSASLASMVWGSAPRGRWGRGGMAHARAWSEA